ncbi:phospholipase D-like domain-containing protein, partial [Thiolapillus sp.]|uniref:phospholipase D-like domain-containing protein n=13 Tax=Thiolapillus sp. TaxID=2017437 RepID=UPI0025FC4F73
FGCLLCFPSGAMRTTGKQCGLAATGVYQPSLRSPWLAASEWVVSAGNLDTEPDPEFVRKKWDRIRARNRSSARMKRFAEKPQSWEHELMTLVDQLYPGTSRLVYDTAVHEGIAQNVAANIFGIMGSAQEELLITNAYIIPAQPAIDLIRDLTDRGVKVRILTNSLATHDVPAVNSHYKPWRDDLILAGAELHELKPDAAIRSLVGIPPVQGEFVGLHTKSFVVDRKRVFIGSMNLDPRSFNINAEAVVVVESPGLGQALAKVMERDMSPQNAWQVKLDAGGNLYWEDDQGILEEQPARNMGQRIQDVIFEAFPREQY